MKDSKVLCKPKVATLSPPTINVNTCHKTHNLNQVRGPLGPEILPAEGPEPGQVIGVVDIVANSDYLMETLNLNTHYLQDTEELQHSYYYLQKQKITENRS